MKSRLIELPYIIDPRGNLSVVEQMEHVPFEIKRVFWQFDVPEGKSRGSHAHKSLRQFVVALSGSLTVNIDDGHEKKAFLLDNPHKGVLIEPGEWSSEDDFTPGTVCLVMASDHYDETDYIRDYDEFLEYIKLTTIVHDKEIHA